LCEFEPIKLGITVECRTTKINGAYELIRPKNKELQAKKMGQKPRLKTLPHKGSVALLNSTHFVEELTK